MRQQRRWFPWRSWTWWNAILDARKELPAADAEALGETEREIQRAVNATLRVAEQRHAQATSSLTAQRATLRQRCANNYAPEYDRLSARCGRSVPQIYLPRPAHVLLFAMIAFGEGVFNLVAFNVFGEAQVFTLLMALTVALGIPLCAHVLGIWLRQWPAPWWRTLVYATATAGVLLAVLAALNEVRFAYLQEIDPGFAAKHSELSSAFFAINVLVLLAATLITYLAYDPEAGFAEAYLRLAGCQRQVNDLEAKLNELAVVSAAEMEATKQTGLALIAYYRRVNRRRRSRVPRYFDDESAPNHSPPFASVESPALPGPTDASDALTQVPARA